MTSSRQPTYNFPIPRSRGGQSVKAQASARLTPVAASTDVKDIILHALLVRIAFDDNVTEEFRTTYDSVLDILDVDIPQDRLDLLTGNVAIGDKAKQYFAWLTGGVDTSTITSDGPITAYGHTNIILVDASSGPVTLTLPDPLYYQDKIIHIKKIDSSNNIVAVLPYDDETIDGDPLLEISIQYESIPLITDTANWFVI